MNMSLKERLTKLRDTASIKATIAKAPAIVAVDLVDIPSLQLNPTNLWQRIARLDSQPITQLSITCHQTEVFLKLKALKDELMITDQCCISIGGLSLPWIHIRLHEDIKWLYGLWNALDTKDFIVFNPQNLHWFGILESER